MDSFRHFPQDSFSVVTRDPFGYSFFDPFRVFAGCFPGDSFLEIPRDFFRDISRHYITDSSRDFFIRIENSSVVFRGILSWIILESASRIPSGFFLVCSRDYFRYSSQALFLYFSRDFFQDSSMISSFML